MEVPVCSAYVVVALVPTQARTNRRPPCLNADASHLSTMSWVEWSAAAKAMVIDGFTYSVPAERIWQKQDRTWIRATLSGNPIEAPLPWRHHPKIKGGQILRVFLASTFWPATLAVELQDAEKGILVTPGTQEFSAKGRVVRVIGEHAILDCGVFVLSELVPVFFIKEGPEVVRRDLKVGDTVVETGGLSFHLADEALSSRPNKA